MIISEDTKAVVDYLNQYTNGNLRKKNDFESILEVCANYDNADTLNRLVFSGKSLWNIYSKMRKVNPNAEGIELLQKETERLCNEMSEFLREISEFADFELKSRFEDVYLARTRGAVKNLIDLAHDLAKFKDLQTELRQRNSH